MCTNHVSLLIRFVSELQGLIPNISVFHSWLHYLVSIAYIASKNRSYHSRLSIIPLHLLCTQSPHTISRMELTLTPLLHTSHGQTSLFKSGKLSTLHILHLSFWITYFLNFFKIFQAVQSWPNHLHTAIPRAVQS